MFGVKWEDPRDRIVYRVTYNPGKAIVNASYNTRFSDGGGIEMFTCQISGGTAELVGYLVHSPLLLTD